MQHQEIKPCPFCGSESVEITSVLGVTYVCCENCSADGPSKYGDHPIERMATAIEAWNERYDSR